MVKNPPATAGDARDVGLTPGGGNGNPLESSCLENPKDGGATGYSPQGRKESDTTERLHLS